MGAYIPTSGRDFEAMLAELFGQLGFEVEMTPPVNDYGADLILRFPSRIGHAIAVQAKFYGGPVDNAPVQEVVASLRCYGASEGWVVTNSTFTSNARAVARANNVRLIDGAELNTLLRQVEMYQDREPVLEALLADSGFFGDEEAPAAATGPREPQLAVRPEPPACGRSKPRLYNMAEVAVRWGCTRGAVEKHIARGLPMFKQPNGRWGVREADLLAYEHRHSASISDEMNPFLLRTNSNSSAATTHTIASKIAVTIRPLRRSRSSCNARRTYWGTQLASWHASLVGAAH